MGRKQLKRKLMSGYYCASGEGRKRKVAGEVKGIAIELLTQSPTKLHQVETGIIKNAELTVKDELCFRKNNFIIQIKLFSTVIIYHVFTNCERFY